MRLAKVLCFMAIGLLPVVAFSLTLEEGAKSILASNPTFKESVEIYNGVLKEYDIAENWYLPTLDLVGSYGYQNVKSPSTNQEKVDGAMNETSLVLTENIFNGFLTENTIKQQKSRLDAACVWCCRKS